MAHTSQPDFSLPEPTEPLPSLTAVEQSSIIRSGRLVKGRELYLVQFQLHEDEEQLECSWSPRGAGTICT